MIPFFRKILRWLIKSLEFLTWRMISDVSLWELLHDRKCQPQTVFAKFSQIWGGNSAFSTQKKEIMNFTSRPHFELKNGTPDEIRTHDLLLRSAKNAPLSHRFELKRTTWNIKKHGILATILAQADTFKERHSSWYLISPEPINNILHDNLFFKFLKSKKPSEGGWKIIVPTSLSNQITEFGRSVCCIESGVTFLHHKVGLSSWLNISTYWPPPAGSEEPSRFAELLPESPFPPIPDEWPYCPPMRKQRR